MNEQLEPGLRAVSVLDVHTHFFPRAVVDLASRTGDERWPSLAIDATTGDGRIMRGATVFRPVAATCFDLESRLDAMDAAGVAAQVLSPVPVTLTTWAEPSLADEFARAQNDAFAAAIASCREPDRFHWIGSVPARDAAAAVRELERGVRELGMRGIEIGTEVNGRELDDASLEELWSAAEELDVAVFVHPTDGVGAIRRGGVPYEFALGMLTDTAMAATALVFGGVLERHPRLRVGLAHGCGTFPWAFPRLARGSTLGSGVGAVSVVSRSAELVRRLWADTLVFDPAHLALLIDRFGADHLMLGSDFPFYPADWGDPDEMLVEAAESGCCPASAVAAMRGDNGRRFLGLAASAAETTEATRAR